MHGIDNTPMMVTEEWGKSKMKADKKTRQSLEARIAWIRGKVSRGTLRPSVGDSMERKIREKLVKSQKKRGASSEGSRRASYRILRWIVPGAGGPHSVVRNRDTQAALNIAELGRFQLQCVADGRSATGTPPYLKPRA